jgi:hypothetical protein
MRGVVAVKPTMVGFFFLRRLISSLFSRGSTFKSQASTGMASLSKQAGIDE